jgi:hypothetical protein
MARQSAYLSHRMTLTSVSSPRTHAHPHRWTLLLALGMAGIGWFLLQRTLGLDPGVFVDEWYYSKMARLTPLADAIVPSYLYLWVFSTTSVCGPGFLDCARIGNVILFVGAAPFLYLTARRFIAPGPACALALVALLAPLGVYTTFFMPEAMYFFGFAVLGWAVLGTGHWPALRRGALGGILLGLMSLVKVHALFLLPALALFVFADSRTIDGRLRAVQGLLAAATAIVTFFGVKFGLGYLFAGAAGMSLFGSFYNSGASSAAHHPLLQLVGPLWVSARGHLMALAMLVGLPLAVLLQFLVDRQARSADRGLTRLWLYTFLMFGSALGVAALFTATIASAGPSEGIRLHSRYYSFALPLLLLAALAPTLGAGNRPPRAPGALLPRALVALVVAMLLLAAWFLLPGYDMRITDGPEFTMLAHPGNVERGLFALGLIVLALWVARPRAATLLFVCVMLPLVLVRSSGEGARYLGHLATPRAADSAGRAARAVIPAAELGTVTIAATDADLFRAQFHMDATDALLLNLPPAAPVDAYQLAPNTRWLVVSGARAIPPGLQAVRAGSDWQVIRLPHTERRLVGKFAFNAAFGSGIVRAADGLATQESWGRWSDGKLVRLYLDRPLPRRATVIIKANAFGANINQPFIARAGNASTTFQLGNDPREVVLQLETDGAQQVLDIEVPRPERPSDDGRSVDTRLLGIALSTLTVEAPAAD